jgi:LPS-assembly lipoprotein
MGGWFWRAVARSVPASALVLALTACGFHPMMGAHGNSDPTVADQLARVQVATIDDRIGQELRNHLIDRFSHDGRSGPAEYRLDVTLQTNEAALTVEKNAMTSRAQWAVTATYRLVHIASNRVMFQDSDTVTPGFDISYAQYASLVSEQAALKRGVESLGELIATRVSVFFARDPDQRPPTTPQAAGAAPPVAP